MRYSPGRRAGQPYRKWVRVTVGPEGIPVDWSSAGSMRNGTDWRYGEGAKNRNYRQNLGRNSRLVTSDGNS